MADPAGPGPCRAVLRQAPRPKAQARHVQRRRDVSLLGRLRLDLVLLSRPLRLGLLGLDIPGGPALADRPAQAHLPLVLPDQRPERHIMGQGDQLLRQDVLREPTEHMQRRRLGEVQEDGRQELDDTGRRHQSRHHVAGRQSQTGESTMR